jgi:excinuclease ABC subunit A
VVEHAPEIVGAADHVIDLGPGAGHGGGRLVVEGPLETVRAHPTSLTARVLRGAAGVGSRRRRRERGRLRVVGARANNLRNLSVEIPLGQLVVATGVSGAGKSTLIRSVLVGNLQREPDRGACTRIEGAEALCVRVGGRHLGDLGHLTLGELLEWLDSLALAPHEAERSGRLREDLRSRIATAVAVGLDYMTLDRPMRTLAGGEAQRIQLAAALGGTLTASLYVLDEPSIGLHARDAERLVSTLQRIRDQGNTVVVVEHAPEIVGAADHVIDLGPGAGHGGGRLVVEGPVETVRAHATSLTGRVLRGAADVGARRRRRERGRLRVVGARANNLRDLSVEIPLGQLVVATGVSGAGKSTLVRSVLVGNLQREPDRGACTRIEGAEALSEVVVMDASPPVRSPRSNPATVSKAFDPIRQRFAATRQARALGLAPGWFSFNVAGGRCDACEGAGEVVVDMQFLDDVRMPCDDCGGRRYRPEALGIRVKGLSIVDILALPVEDALALFSDDRRIARRLEPLARVGLGYVALGQPLSTLSGGEAQRLRIARALTCTRRTSRCCCTASTGSSRAVEA